LSSALPIRTWKLSDTPAKDPAMTTHLLITYPPLAEGAAPYTAKMCKVADGGTETPDAAAVTCGSCLKALLQHEIGLWKRSVSEAAAVELSDGIESDDGYGVWHERAGDVCLAIASTPISTLVKIGDGHRRIEISVDWYCKLTPVHESYMNHGWQVKVAYRHESMGGYEHIDLWAPMDTDVHVLAQLVQIQRRAAAKAIEHGLRLGAADQSAQVAEVAA
jgi:hypothetical protein